MPDGPPPSSSPPPPRPLHDLVFLDIQPEGQLLVLSFLTTNERLRLSECCTGLKRYRAHLKRFQVVPHPPPSSSSTSAVPLEKALPQLLREQLYGACLSLGVQVTATRRGDDTNPRSSQSAIHRHNLAVLRCLQHQEKPPTPAGAAGEGGGQGLRGLDVALTNEDEVEALREAILGGACRDLRYLHLHLPPFPSLPLMTAFHHLMQVLTSHGSCCRNLRGLYLENIPPSPTMAVGGLLATAMLAGRMGVLEELEMKTAVGGVEDLARAMEGGGCRSLRKLHLASCSLSPSEGRALSQALRVHACPRLEGLSLANNREVGEEAMVAILGALEKGVCPKLARLDLEYCRLMTESGAALGRALSGGGCPYLRWLNLSSGFLGKAGIISFFHSFLGDGTSPHGQAAVLSFLDLSHLDMGPQHAGLLGEVILAGRLGGLEELWLQRNGLCPAFWAALGEGGCPSLHVLVVEDVGFGPQEATAMAKAVMSGSLRGLRRLSLSKCYHLGDGDLAGIIMALMDACPGLRWLNLCLTEMAGEAGQALLRSLRRGTWPMLEYLNVLNFELPDRWPEELAEVLLFVWEGARGGQLSIPRLQELSLACNQFDSLRVLADAFRRGACPLLKSLTLVLPEPGVGAEDEEEDRNGGGGSSSSGISSRRREEELRCIDEVKASLAGRAHVSTSY